ncbi:sulfotransferase [Nocardioides sp. cx-173]|uniref:sulfotransferase n=1 Tax=Nocardioides sp. cx-173 TaxID=2898796 RepID=UPI001E4192BD|nr:sulfotransferase [Nocardioides sp. cx-173]MCD4524611.1 sulfotransferase [Nocardioides sp. cx-173]UGB42907.1 sulfotransferase [Nocardioides sp. cx-173]
MKTFLLGPGCQKGGTTWLYQYLKASPQFAHGYRKEYHVFDARDLPSESRTREKVIRLAEESIELLRRGETGAADVLHRLSMVANPRFYFDYFTGLLHQRDDHLVTGDFTPDYALLSVAQMRTIRRGFERRGVRAAAVFLLRDPVERTWSQVRMQDAREPGRFSEPSEVVLQRRHADPVYALRNQYQDTVRVLDEVFGEDVHYEFYERLFTDRAVGAICRFAGIDQHPGDFGTVLNSAGRSTAAVPEDITREVAERYRHVYTAVAARFPDTDLRELWPSARFVLD